MSCSYPDAIVLSTRSAETVDVTSFSSNIQPTRSLYAATQGLGRVTVRVQLLYRRPCLLECAEGVGRCHGTTMNPPDAFVTVAQHAGVFQEAMRLRISKDRHNAAGSTTAGLKDGACCKA